jgi:hypothetical protein
MGDKQAAERLSIGRWQLAVGFGARVELLNLDEQLPERSTTDKGRRPTGIFSFFFYRRRVKIRLFCWPAKGSDDGRPDAYHFA